ncbi:hypothetical protein KFL_000690155 [Klebsormidium nitens]|uniref:Uncharacterized protein n=1 Tax=Klebsormidium nitens TaxID=105231 RepID=A0A1Y1HQX0_KLENI|nr:hypothetical protein KFL_000690155 [Klebsormidium nitens]|eukprot:GAQ81035.1 hypothetical protein KFL_000690155 [Klebsormidium nitens]
MEAGGSQNSETGNGGAVKPLQPKVRRSSVSSLSGTEIEQRMTEKGAVELDLLRPESSAWLKGIFKQIRSGDLETRFCALWRFKDVFNNMAVAKGSGQITRFAAYMLEQGILEEGVYFAKPVTAGEFAARGLESEVPSDRHEYDKKPALGILLQLSVWSKQARSTICSRTVFLRRVLRDCMARSEFAQEMIERVVVTSRTLLQDETCNLVVLFDELLDVSFRALLR